MNAFDLVADRERNILHTYFRGVVSGDMLKTHLSASAALIDHMDRGFTVVTDLAELQSMELDCVPHVTAMMDHFVTAGVAKVVRVIPDPEKDIGFNLLSLTHYRGRIPIVTCLSRDDAERELATTMES